MAIVRIKWSIIYLYWVLCNFIIFFLFLFIFWLFLAKIPRNIFKFICESLVNRILNFINSKWLRFWILNCVLVLSSIVSLLRVLLELIQRTMVTQFHERAHSTHGRASSPKCAQSAWIRTLPKHTLLLPLRSCHLIDQNVVLIAFTSQSTPISWLHWLPTSSILVPFWPQKGFFPLFEL